MRFYQLAILVCFCWQSHALGQSLIDQHRGIMEFDPWVSSGSAGLGHGSSTAVTYMDAPYYNPAGLGGLSPADKKDSRVKMVNFPYAGMIIGRDSPNLKPDFAQMATDGDPLIGAALTNASASPATQYARYSIVPSFTYGSLMFAYGMDTQLNIDQAEAPNTYTTHYHAKSGPSVGWSGHDNSGRVYLGAFVSQLGYSIVADDLVLEDVSVAEARKEALKESTHKYKALHTHVGGLFVISQKKWPSTISLVARNFGNTMLKADAPADEDVKIKQDITLGYRLSPRLGKWGRFDFMLDFEKLDHHEISFSRKVKTSTQIVLGQTPEGRPYFSLRGGYGDAGASYGLGFNFGIFGVDVASYHYDTGVDDETEATERMSGTVAIDVARF